MNDVADRSQVAQELDQLAHVAEDILHRARAAGATAAEVTASVSAGLDVSVRLGELETVERNRDRGFALTVYFDQRKGSASTADLATSSIAATVAQACAIAKYTEADPCSGLADAARMAHDERDLDLYHPWDIDVAAATDLALAMEDAARQHAGITNSEGANVQTGASYGVYANTHGFIGKEAGTRHTLSCALIAGDSGGMQRDYWYDTARHKDALDSAAAIGNEAARRTLARMGARRLRTQQCPVVFAPSVARGLIGHFLSAVSGGALYRESSFLLDSCGEQLFPDFIHMQEQPWLERGPASATFDGEGVATAPSVLVADGVLQRYILGSYAARKLGLASTANAGGMHNLVIKPGQDDLDALLKRMDTGLLVTDVMGQGVSIVTGDYSRGASGFWVEHGEIAYPVEEITIASNLRDMFRSIVAIGADVDRRHRVMTGSLLLERMTVAGE